MFHGLKLESIRVLTLGDRLPIIHPKPAFPCRKGDKLPDIIQLSCGWIESNV